MTHQGISLNAIDFSSPEGEFTFRRESYLLKQCVDSYFIRNKTHVGLEFTYLLDHKLAESICQQEVSPQVIEELLEDNHNYIHRCVQYKEAIFGFGVGQDKYYSQKYNGWIYLKPINYKAFKNISLEEVLENPYEFFIERAATAYSKELPLIEDEDLFYSSIHQGNQKIEFICGSRLELERLTQLAAFSLPGLRSIFRYSSSSSITLTYGSETYNQSGGVHSTIRPEGLRENQVLYYLWWRDQQLCNLIFKYNLFIGVDWLKYRSGSHGYPSHYFQPCIINIEIQAPSQHERLEAEIELRSWLEGKLPEDEIESYFN